MKHDAAFVEPVRPKFNFAWKRIKSGFRPRRVGIGNEPKLFALRKFFREISEDVGEDFAFAALGTANPGQPDPLRLNLTRYHWAVSGSDLAAQKLDKLLTKA